MRFLLRGFLVVPLLILFSCSAPVDIEGDVFLVKGDGKPQPSAAKEVIFLEAESFESFLIDVYLNSVQEEARKNSVIIKELCSVSSTASQKQISTLENKLSSSFEEGVSKGITDPDGSCALLIKAEDDSEKAASLSTQNYNDLLEDQKSKIASAYREISSLKNKLEGKITSRTNELYNQFSKDIEISISEGGSLFVRNNSNHNVKLNQNMCLQFYNALGDPVGHSITDYHSLGDCSSYKSYEYENNGTVIESSELILNQSEDSFGFSKGGYLAKGQTVQISTNLSRVNYGSPNNYFCSRSFSSSEKLQFTKKYGENQKDWPNIFKPDTKGYKILKPTKKTAKDVCGIYSDSPSRFIPLEDEVKTDSGDVITYTSKPVSFREIASEEQYSERNLIKKQERIVTAAKKELKNINAEMADDNLIAQLKAGTKLVNQCKYFVAQNDSIKERVASLNQSLSSTNQCDIDNTNLNSDFKLESPGDLAKLESLSKVSYSALAGIDVLNKFMDAPYKSSTNISGHYSLKEVPPGNYVIYSSYQDNFNEGIYLLNKEIKEGGAVDLSNANFLAVGSLANLLDVFYEKCSQKVCGEDDLRNTLDIREAVRRYEKRKGELEELQDSLERLKNLYN